MICAVGWWPTELGVQIVVDRLHARRSQHVQVRRPLPRVDVVAVMDGGDGQLADHADRGADVVGSVVAAVTGKPARRLR